MSDPISILVVEDEEDLAESIRMLVQLHNSDWKITVVANGTDAFRKITDNHYDAILSDFRLPGMSGITLLRAIRESGNECPFVFMTAYADHSLLIEALQLGAYDFLEKPIDSDRLMKVLADAVTYSRGIRKIYQDLQDSVQDRNASKGQVRQIEEIHRKLAILRFSKREGGQNE
jgi:DNA-binding NtrC family response regulator